MLFNVGILVLAFTCIVSSSEVQLAEDQSAHVSGWIKISPHQVCFGAKGNSHGSFHNYVKAGLTVAIKLEYVSGKVRCVSAVEYNSNWGCGHYAGVKSYPLNVVVTDHYDQVLFPRKESLAPNGYKYGLWYWLPFTNTVSSKQLIFTNFATPFYFPLHEQMRIWYGEDLKNWYEGDNQGRVCVNVYAKFLN